MIVSASSTECPVPLNLDGSVIFSHPGHSVEEADTIIHRGMDFMPPLKIVLAEIICQQRQVFLVLLALKSFIVAGEPVKIPRHAVGGAVEFFVGQQWVVKRKMSRTNQLELLQGSSRLISLQRAHGNIFPCENVHS